MCHSEQVALAYRQAGLCILPANVEQKRPALSSWKEYQKRLPTEEKLHHWFKTDQPMCIIAGAISRNNEMLDFDCSGELFERWCNLVRIEAPGLLERLVFERTQNNGVHVSYCCQSPVCGSVKLAMRTIETPDDQPIVYAGKQYVPRESGDKYLVIVVLIETRGEGGLYLCDPSPGYKLFQGTFEKLPVLSEQEREILLEAAYSLNEYVPEPINPPSPPQSIGLRPGDDFNERGDVRELLRKHGWTLARSGENEHWRRPGKTIGWSATFKDRVLYVFSSNATPFDQNRAYSPFAVYAMLEHSGDFNIAAQELGRQGYGDQQSAATDVDLSEFEIDDEEEPPTIWELINRHPKLRAPVIHGLLRRGETMNIIAAPKTGKSWLVNDLALAIATGQPWLDSYNCEQGDVLILDNELHPETSAHRIPKVADTRGIMVGDYGKRIHVRNMRGQLRDVFSLGKYFKRIRPGRYRVVILDAFYRFMPRDMDENDNGTMANIYNHIDRYADQLGCCFILIHHSTKGNQSNKAVTDVGAGAGSQSRATDTHLVLRPHEEAGAVVLDAAARSWSPIEPMVLRWSFPVWTPALDLDPAMLRSEKPKRKDDKTAGSDWNEEQYVRTFITATPSTKADLADRAKRKGLSERHASSLLRLAEERGLVHRWVDGPRMPIKFASVPQPVGVQQ